MKWFAFLIPSLAIFLSSSIIEGKPSKDHAWEADDEISHRSPRHSKSQSVPTAPLDINQNIHHTLDELNSILGTVGGAGSSAVMGLTGISLTDCGLSFQDEDMSSISCSEFIDKLSQCDSLQHLQPYLQKAKQRYRMKPNSRAPCFQNRTSKSKGRHG